MLLSATTKLGAELHRVKHDGLASVVVDSDQNLDLSIGVGVRMTQIQPDFTLVKTLSRQSLGIGRVDESEDLISAGYAVFVCRVRPTGCHAVHLKL